MYLYDLEAETKVFWCNVLGHALGRPGQHVAYAVPESERNESGCQLVGLRDLVWVTLLVFNGQNRMDPD
jgi:hypothetical protein